MMRKPRDFDSEMKTLTDRAKLLKERKVQQLGELIIATGADALPVETLAGVLLAAIEARDPTIMEGWRMDGAAFFQSAGRSAARRTRGNARVTSADDRSPQPTDRTARAE